MVGILKASIKSYFDSCPNLSVSVCPCVCVYVHLHVEDRGQLGVSFFRYPSTLLSKAGSLTDRGLAEQSR